MASKHTTSTPLQTRVVIVGGGLAGMAAACHLLDSGFSVTLVEKRPFLGGRAFSFVDQETGCQVDNGQHVFLGCCTYYIDFLKRLGTFNRTYLQPSLEVKVIARGGRAGVLKSAPLPAPFHVGPSFLRYPHLTMGEKLRVIYALARIYTSSPGDPRLESQSFYHWLKQHRQSERAMRNLWELIIRPTLNDTVRNVSAAMGVMVFQEGLLRGRGNGNVGYARAGLSAIMGQAAEEYIRRRGGKLLMGRPVTQLLWSDGALAGAQLAGGEVVEGDVYVSALPYFALEGLLPPALARHGFFSGLSQLSAAPIVDLHIWYDRPVMAGDFAAFLDSPLQWVFNKSQILGMNGGPGQYICVSLSGAWEYIHQPKEALRSLFLQEIAQAFPKARDARVERFLVVKEERATLRCLPGTRRHRLSPATPVKNLFLAGDWTDTGWPSTMEGAVRSGIRAAQAVMVGRTA